MQWAVIGLTRQTTKSLSTLCNLDSELASTIVELDDRLMEETWLVEGLKGFEMMGGLRSGVEKEGVKTSGCERVGEETIRRPMCLGSGGAGGATGEVVCHIPGREVGRDEGVTSLPSTGVVSSGSGRAKKVPSHSPSSGSKLVLSATRSSTTPCRSQSLSSTALLAGADRSSDRLSNVKPAEGKRSKGVE